ncbi:hypothetical protein Sjap_006321 [Stephania japonica]|uniref:Kinesin light chain n=1 Tax=Stephania japonica TaxID=461633 RepID=A0AAP0K756_9MAGN
MKATRSASSLLSRITSQQSRTHFYRVLSRRFLSEISVFPTSDKHTSSSPHAHLKPCERTNGLLVRKTHFQQFQTNNTLVDRPPHLSSRQRKMKKKSDIEEEFESATTTDDILRGFEAMESAFDEDDVALGLACLKVGLHLEQEGESPEKTLEFGNRALKIFDRNDSDDADKESLPIAMTLHMMGSACYSLKRFNDSLGYLNRANRVLSKLESEGYSADDIRPVLHAVQLGLANTKTAMGRREEALANHRKCLELKEMTLEPSSREIGVANRDLAEAYVAVLNFKEALPHCVKALDIHKAQLGDNSVEVAHDRRLLGVIYAGLEEHQKALEQNVLSQKVLKKWGLNSELLRAEVDAANIQIALGKYHEAIDTLKSVVQQTDKESKTRALIFIAMANALCNLEKFADSKRCMEISSSILGKKEKESPVEVAEAYMEIAALYETMNEFETAITLLKRSLAILEKLPHEQHSEGNALARLGWLLLLTGKVEQAITYLESAAERLRESFGSKHFGVGYICNNLGAAYLELNRPQSAAQMFAMAKEIMEVSLGPHHADSIEACQNLSKAYAAMGRGVESLLRKTSEKLEDLLPMSYVLAMDFQQQVINAWVSHGPRMHDELREAQRVLEQLKEKARGLNSDDISTKALPLPRTAESASTKRS